MDSLFLFLISFVCLFFIYLIVFYFRGLKKHKIKDSMQVQFILMRQGLKKKDINEKNIGIIICLIDPLIISTSGVIASSVKLNYIWQILIGFALLMGLIYSLYEILGRIIKRKSGKNGNKKD